LRDEIERVEGETRVSKKEERMIRKTDRDTEKQRNRDIETERQAEKMR
jgi:hypothetical protein